jgi:glutathione-regulated potassium-efflux system protein KefB
MDLDVRYTIRETLVSSLEMSEKVLETLGLSKANAIETVRKFRTHDEATMATQHAVKDDEKKFMESIRESAQQLQHLFETDVPQQEQPAVKRRAGKSQ